MSQTHYLPPSKIKLRESAEGNMVLDMDGQTVALAPPKRALPISEPDRYIVLTNTEGEEIGVVRAVADLDPHSRAILDTALKRAYVMERITRVLEVEKEALSGQTRWRVEIAISEQEMEDTRPVTSILKRALSSRSNNDSDEASTADGSDENSNTVQKVRWLKRQATSADSDDDSDEDNTEVIVSRVVTEEREFYISGQEDVKTARYPQIFIVDTEGHHYEILNCEELDLASRRAAERFI